MKKVFCIFIIASSFLSCTENQRARNFGGSEVIKLNPNEVFINISWKQDNLWVIVKDTLSGLYYAREKSSYGLMEGRIVIEK